MTNKLVYDVEPATPTMISSLDRHCRFREKDGSSDIDLERVHLNRTIIGSESGVSASLSAFYEAGVSKPATQSESPYLRIVVSASPAYFRPHDPEASGTWDDDRLEAWLDATMKQLKKQHGDDLVHVELHLDEVTPHIHAVVAPTYQKKKRKPGRKKRNETDDEFQLRKLMAETSKQRTVGRSSHAMLSKANSFQVLRENMFQAVAHLGIEYGDALTSDDPAPKTTRQFVKEQAAKQRLEDQRLKTEALALQIKARNLEEIEADLDRREDQISAAEKSVLVLAGMIQKCGSMICLVLGIKAKPDLIEMIEDIEQQTEEIKLKNEDEISASNNW
jgi:hypothetical protein